MHMILKDGKKKVLTLSYDDAIKADKRLMRILDAKGIKCTFNVNSGGYSDGSNPDDRRMTKAEAIAAFKNSGHEVALHGYTHPHLHMLDEMEIIREIAEDKKGIERDYGIIARGMAYPYGSYDDRVVDILKKCGIVYARTVAQTLSFDIPADWLRLPATCHHNHPELMTLAKRFVETEHIRGFSQMFYVWGHSYEFDNDNNWHVIEEFADFIGGRDDIWYATNIEIFDYITAYQRLETSYEKNRIHNPSGISVWVQIDGKVYEIKPNEKLNI